MSKKKSYSTEYKREAADLIVSKNYTIKDACEAMGVSQSAIRRWATQLRQERAGITPKGSRALTDEQQQIQTLKATITRLEREKEILKKASALLMSDSYHV